MAGFAGAAPVQSKGSTSLQPYHAYMKATTDFVIENGVSTDRVELVRCGNYSLLSGMLSRGLIADHPAGCS